jgi:uncharacterized protein
MPLLVNLRHLASHDLALEGEVSAAELDLDTRDEMIRIAEPVQYQVQVQKLDRGLLLRGRLQLTLDCQCVRCLKPFKQRLAIEPWTCHVSLEGEEAAPVDNDCVDLTPYIREDILLAFPQHPLCDPQCEGLNKAGIAAKKKRAKGESRTETASSTWAELDKLKF